MQYILLNYPTNQVYVVDYNQYLYLPMAKLNTKPNPNGHHSVVVWVHFGDQVDSLEKYMKSDGAARPRVLHMLNLFLAYDCPSSYLSPFWEGEGGQGRDGMALVS